MHASLENVAEEKAHMRAMIQMEQTREVAGVLYSTCTCVHVYIMYN